MRVAAVSFAGLALLPVGCSALIAESGQDLTALATPQQVRQELGEPSAAGTTGDQPYEEFRTRRKISEPFRAHSMRLGAGMSLGLLELLFLPDELCRNAARFAVGQTIRFEYDRTGKVARVYVNGYPLLPTNPAAGLLIQTENQPGG